jgi:hypothetical protein
MHRPRPSLVALLAALAAGATGCGGSDGPAREPRDRAEPAPARVVERDACGRPTAAPLDARHELVDLVTGRSKVDAAATRRTVSGGRFVTDLTVAVSRGPHLRGTLTGRRDANGTSSGTIRWRGASSLLVPDLDLRIVDDRLLVRRRSGDRTWATLGSASGVALDVGRELLMHPFLLRSTTASRAGDLTEVQLLAPPADLRTYATSERRGPVTDLLRRTTSLRLVVHLRGNRLVRDEFDLATTLPDDVVPGFGGRAVRIVGTTAHC